MKIDSVWTVEQSDGKGLALVVPMSATHIAVIESAHTPGSARELSAFAQQFEREARRRGFDYASRQVVIRDGAHWIWNNCSQIFPQAIQIVDIFHAKEKSWDLGKQIYCRSTDLARQ